MKCPIDGADTRVLSTRKGDQRRRECELCGRRFTTVEVITSRRDLLTAARLARARQNLTRLGLLRPAE